MTGEELAKLLEPTVDRLGYELTDLELHRGRDCVIRLYIDRPEGIGLDDCEAVSRQVSVVLDVEDPVPGHYVLEVSSPGLDRKLTRVEHYRRFVGADVRLQLRAPVDGRRKYRGRLTVVKEDAIEVDVDGRLLELPLEAIESARLVPAL